MKWLNQAWTEDRLAAFADLITEQGGRAAIRERWKEIPDEDRAWLSDFIQAGRLPTSCTPVFALPVFSPEACAYLIERTKALHWSENEDEEEAYRMPELVLGHTDRALDEEVKRALFAGLAPWLIGIWGRLPSTYASVQMTRYNPAEREGGNYHIDNDADYTAVIALNGDFEGGGTAIVDGLVGELPMPPLPPGFALIFDGKRTLHKGLPVTAGTRYLLTVWAANDANSW